MKHQDIKRFFTYFIFAFIFSLTSVSKVAAIELLAPQVAIEKASNILKEKLQDKDFTKNFAKINDFVKEVIDPHTDFNKIASLVAGKYWRRATEDERKAFEKEFKILLVRTYSRAFVGFEDWSVRFLPLDMEKSVRNVGKAKSIFVKTEILQPDKRPFSINYRMWLVEGKWKVYDIVIEGISLVKNYRTSISAKIKKSGSSLGKVTEYLAKKNSDALAGADKKEQQS